MIYLIKKQKRSKIGSVIKLKKIFNANFLIRIKLKLAILIINIKKLTGIEQKKCCGGFVIDTEFIWINLAIKINDGFIRLLNKLERIRIKFNKTNFANIMYFERFRRTRL